MKWLRRISFVVGWALVVTAGWLKGGDDAEPAVLLALLIAGGVILVGRAAMLTRAQHSALDPPPTHDGDRHQG
ncbi:MAG: hypothetical protein M3N47_12620 [Chloroflexota bacterium]|nr:hypothetical protein [Chloroflexota bacterium]